MSDKAAEVFLRTPETDPSSGRHPEPAPVRRTRARLVLATICGAMLLAMMGLTVADVLGRYLLGAPITGATELTEMMLAAVIFLGLPAVSLDRTPARPPPALARAAGGAGLGGDAERRRLADLGLCRADRGLWRGDELAAPADRAAGLSGRGLLRPWRGLHPLRRAARPASHLTGT